MYLGLSWQMLSWRVQQNKLSVVRRILQYQYYNMEGLEQENANIKVQINKIDFRMFIKNIEISCEKSLLSRKNRILLKQKFKQNWLHKTKIIPPTFPKFQQTPNTSNPNLKAASLHEHTFYNEIMLTQSKEAQTQKDLSYRKNSTCHQVAIRNVASCGRIRSNWKLQFRKDELNILKYSKNQENCLNQASTKSFKVRKIPKKFEEIKQEVHSIYKTNLEQGQDNRERLRTIQNGPQKRHRQFFR